MVNTRGLLRGKRTDNGEWVEGFYVHLQDPHKKRESHRIYSGYAECDCDDFFPDWYGVDPDTVGRYTGLDDKNEEMIFEGDVVKIENDVFVVKWAAGFASFALRHPTNMRQAPALTPITVERMEVIGNIHDNPELIGGTDNG